MHYIKSDKRTKYHIRKEKLSLKRKPMEDFRLPAPLVGMLKHTKLTGMPVVQTDLQDTKLSVTIIWDLATSAPKKSKKQPAKKKPSKPSAPSTTTKPSEEDAHTNSTADAAETTSETDASHSKSAYADIIASSTTASHDTTSPTYTVDSPAANSGQVTATDEDQSNADRSSCQRTAIKDSIRHRGETILPFHP